MQVFKHQQQWLHLAFAQQHALECREQALAALRRVEAAKRTVVREYFQRDRSAGGCPARPHRVLAPGPSPWPALCGGRRTPPGGSIVSAGRGRESRVLPYHRTPRRSPAPASPGAGGMDELIGQARLAHPRLAHQRHHLAVPGGRLRQHRCRASSSCCRPTKRVSPRAAVACKRRRSALAPTSSKTSTGSGKPLTGTEPKAFTRTSPSTSPRVLGVSRMLPGVAICSIRAARTVVSPTAE